MSEIDSVMYNFHFNIIKVKADKLRSGKKAIKYKNSQTILASNIDQARWELDRKLKKLGDVMIEEISFSKTVYSIHTIDGRSFASYAVDIDTSQ